MAPILERKLSNGHHREPAYFLIRRIELLDYSVVLFHDSLER
jgi:hypothetical protein